MELTQILLLSLVVVAASCLAELQVSRKNDRLFQQFPLHKSLQAVNAAEHSGKPLADFSTLVQQVAQQEEKARVDRITRALEKSSSEELSQVTRQQPLSFSVFHNYDSEAIVMYGKADLRALRLLLKDEHYKPIPLGETEFGIVAVWIIKHKDTSIGAFNQLLVTTLVATRNLGYTLGVSYEEGNDASLIFPAFGKLPEHARFLVLNSATDQPAGKQFAEKVNSFPTAHLNFGSLEFVSRAKTQNVAHADSCFSEFKFVDSQNELILQGSIAEEGSWRSWFSTSYKILRALGLSGVIDLWYSKYVPAKFVTPTGLAGAPCKFTTWNMDMKQSFHEISKFELQMGEKSEIGRRLRNLKFSPSMVVRMPLLQYAQMMPRDHSEDHEYTLLDEPLSFTNEEKLKELRNTKSTV